MLKAPLRPLSAATEIFDVDSDVEADDDVDEEEELVSEEDDEHAEWTRHQMVEEADEDDDSEFEEDLYGVGKRSFESVSDFVVLSHWIWLPMLTLILQEDGRRRSQTTLSSYDEIPTPECGLASRPFDWRNKPVEGPKGPHLFRSSQSSAEFAFDHALQMSPLIPIKLDIGNELLRRSSSGSQQQQPVEQPDLSDIDDEDAHSIIRRWSPRDVIEWMTSWQIDPSVIRCFENHDINGAVLLDLQFEHLRELDIESFGKRHRLWNAICILRGDDEPSPPPRSESSRPSTRNTNTRPASQDQCASEESDEADAVPAPLPAEPRKRRGRKDSAGNHDTILPGESVSIVAIEQLLPKPHTCSKGEQCAKWQKQQVHIQLLQQGNAIGCFPISPSKGGRTRVPLSPGNRLQVPGRRVVSALPSPRSAAMQQSEPGTPMRPTSEAVPSVVASSDLLGPGTLPTFNLDADMLGKIEKRDPQDNVRNFLQFQHINSPGLVPPTPPADSADAFAIPRSHSVPPVPQMFPTQHHQAYPSLAQRSMTPGQDDRLRGLPRLDIPRAASADAAGTSQQTNNPISARTMTASPTQIYRLGTPASEMDVPVTAIPMDRIARDVSQSVPPNMQFRQPTHSPRTAVHRPADWRRPSLLPAVKEGEVYQPRPSADSTRSTAKSKTSIDSTNSSASTRTDRFVADPAHSSPITHTFGYGEACTQSGWMKKRRTKMLRHEWQEAHFRLTGTRLNMHESARLTAALKDSIDVDDYAVTCSSAPSNSKLSAAMRAFRLGDSEKAAGKDFDPTAFAFQLVPERETAVGGKKKFAAPAVLGKTHHFAVQGKDQRIDWMREIMLAKALQQKGKGYNVEINGVQA